MVKKTVKLNNQFNNNNKNNNSIMFKKSCEQFLTKQVCGRNWVYFSFIQTKSVDSK